MIPDYQLWHGDCLQKMDRIEDNSIDLMIQDPPCFRVKGDYWDRQWNNSTDFLAWIGKLCEVWKRKLKPNGSLYVFASPQMSARVEVKIGEYFNALNNIRWIKEVGWHNKADEEILRSYLSPWEAVIFAEQWWSDNSAEDGTGYYSQCKALHKDVYSPIGRYIQTERELAGVTRNDVEVALGYISSSDPTRGTALCYRWEEGSSLPTKETYYRLREYLNSVNGHSDYLRRDYEDLRRPFQASESSPYTDVWTFPTVQPYPGKHPCEKPLELLEHIINVSSKLGTTVLDCFFGSCNTGLACIKTGRKFIGIEADKNHFERGKQRMIKIGAELRCEWKPLQDTGGAFEGLPLLEGIER